ncbi:MAG: lysylphosphatidylglycerol synthase transmembrane domain-containing protein [Gaiellales bacterium]
MRHAVLHTRRGRTLLLLGIAGLLAGLLVWRAPDLHYVGRAFRAVSWEWVAVAIGFNLVSVIVRAAAWHIVLNQALPDSPVRHRHVFSAFSVGLLGNAVVPGRVGEVARVAVLGRHLPDGAGAWPSVGGSVLAHRVFDVIPAVGLVAFVVATARIPDWALPGIGVMLAIGGVVLVGGLVVALRRRRRGSVSTAGAGRVRRLYEQGVDGLRVLHSPGPALLAMALQILGWTTQLLAVYFAFKAFQIDEPIAAAAVVLLAINVAIAFPLWPGSVGLFQAAAALALLPYGIAYQHGFAYGIGLQAIEMSVGIGLGALFLAREGISFAMLKQIPTGDRLEGERDPRPVAGEQQEPAYRVPRHGASVGVREPERVG